MSATDEARRLRARVRIVDNGEPLVDFLEVCPALRFAENHPLFSYRRVRLLRRTVAELLCRAQALLPSGVTLEIVEGWRSAEVQQMMYRATYEEFRDRHPEWPEARLRRHTNRYSAPPHARTPRRTSPAAPSISTSWTPRGKCSTSPRPSRSSTAAAPG